MAKGPEWEVANFDEKMDGLNAPSAVGLGLSPGSFFSICQILMIQAGLLRIVELISVAFDRSGILVLAKAWVHDLSHS